MNNPAARKTNLVIQQLSNETLIYDLHSNKAICLNETATFIWQNCNGNNSVAAITRLLKEKFGKQISDDFVLFALEQLKEQKLLENSVALPWRFEQPNRRKIIKQIGLTSAIALPIVSSIVAPLAVNAQSNTCNTGTSCSCNGMGFNGGSCSSSTCSGSSGACICTDLRGCNPGGNFCMGICSG